MTDHTTNASQNEVAINATRKYCTNPNCEHAGRLLPLSNFYKLKGGRFWDCQCKKCRSQAAKQRYATRDTETFANTSKICSNLNCRRAGKLLNLSEFHKDRYKPDGHLPQCKECANNRYAEYRSTPKGREQRSKWSAEYKKKNSDAPQFKARYAVNLAIQRGTLIKPTNLLCIDCGCQAKEYHHHLGYSEEHYLDVVPVCIPCHTKIHH